MLALEAEIEGSTVAGNGSAEELSLVGSNSGVGSGAVSN